LHLDRPVADGASGSDGVAEVAGEVVEGAAREVCREVVDDDDGLASAMGGFAAEDDAAERLWLRLLGFGGRGLCGRGSGGSDWQRAEAGEGVAEARESALRGIGVNALLFFGAHGGGNEWVDRSIAMHGGVLQLKKTPYRHRTVEMT